MLSTRNKKITAGAILFFIFVTFISGILNCTTLYIHLGILLGQKATINYTGLQSIMAIVLMLWLLSFIGLVTIVAFNWDEFFQKPVEKNEVESDGEKRSFKERYGR